MKKIKLQGKGVKIKVKKKIKLARFYKKRLKIKTEEKHSNLLTILKKGLKKKKRKVRLAGKNFYVLSFKKLLAFQRQYSFFRMRYSSDRKFKYKNHKNFHIFVNRRKYRNTILKRGIIKNIIRLGFFKRFIERGRKQKMLFKIKQTKVKAFHLFTKIRKLIFVLRMLLLNKELWNDYYNNKYFSRFYFSQYVKRVFKTFKRLALKLRKYRRKYRNLNKFYKLRKLKVRRLSHYNIVVKKSYNNFFLTAFSKFDGTVYEKITGAASELKGAKRATTTALERISNNFIKELILHKVLKKKFDFVVKTPYLSRGVKNAIRTISSFKKRIFVRSKRKAFYRKLKIRNIILKYNISHNGYKEF